MPTRPVDAYEQGRQARRDHPDATTWEGINPFGVHNLFYAWMDGWRDQAGEWHWTLESGVKIMVPVGVEGGRCPECWHYPLRRHPRTYRLWCIQYPCMTLLGRPKGLYIGEGPEFKTEVVK